MAGFTQPHDSTGREDHGEQKAANSLLSSLVEPEETVETRKSEQLELQVEGL